MHEAVDNLEAAIPTTDPAEVYVVHKALSSAIKVIARADDSSGIIGDACRRLLELHPTVAAAAQVPAGSLADWMVRFQFDGDVDYFEIDPVAYAPALSKSGWRHIEHDYQILSATALCGGPLDVATIARLVRDRVERWLCDQLRVVNPVVMGHSMGGNVAFELARRGNAGVRL